MGKKSSPPPAPDYAALAKQTAEDQRKQLAIQTAANRPNRVNAYGEEKWSQDPAGAWTQTTTLNPAEQAQLDANRGIQKGLTDTAGGLLGQAQGSLSKPLTTEGLPAWQGYDTSKLAQSDPNAITQGLPAMGTAPTSGPMGNTSIDAGPMGNTSIDGGAMGVALVGGQFNMSPTGNNKAIQDAWMSRIAPQRQLQRSDEVNRLKQQGITENSDAWTRALRRMDEGDTDAQNQALIHGTQEYGNEFQRGLAKDQSNFGQGMQTADFANKSNQQRFSQGLNTANLVDSQNRQKFSQGLDTANLVDRQNQQQFGQEMQGADFANQSNQQQFGQNAQLQAMLSALRGQQFGEQGAQAALSGNQRGAMLTEQQALRQSPLNDLQSLMGGNPNNPAFAQFTNAGLGQGVDYSGAGKDQYQAQLDAYNAKQKRSSNSMGGLFSLGGMALGGMYGGPAGAAMGGQMGSALGQGIGGG
jgi:hypothetical protein